MGKGDVKSESPKQDQEQGSPGRFLGFCRTPMGGVCSLAIMVAKKTGLTGQGAFAAYPRQAKRRLSAVFHDPLDQAGVFLPFSRHRKPSSH